jgi:chromosomal replication initiation ATPase DnaA
LLLALQHGAGQSCFGLPDLRSRLLTLPVAVLSDPDDELLSALYVKQFRDRQITLDAATASYLATHGARDAAGIRALIERLDRAALAGNRKITVALARMVMENRDE